MIEKSIKEDFLDLFYHDLKGQELHNNNTLELFTLKVKNNGFSYDELVSVLGNKLCYFALSRKQIDELIKEERYNDLIKNAKSKLRDHNVNEGELGEILLFCLLESHLNAPKILTKLELKTSSNDYVKGADGVHLFQVSENEYQLIFGESKLEAKVNNGISSAFKSIKKFISTKKIGYEMNLISSELIKESYDESNYKLLKKLIVPSAKEEESYLDYSFGIFLGFDTMIKDEHKSLSNGEFRKIIREQIKNEVVKALESFNFQLKKAEFCGYKFYIYAIPFSDLANKRKEIIKLLEE
jgi:hypothetical protein